MQIVDRRTFLKITAGSAALAITPPASAEGVTGTRVFTSDAAGTFVGSTLILGDAGAVLIDAQTDRANATALADMIAATGRRLETIVVTHVHPDHFLGLDILLQRFPDARPVVHAALQPILEQAGPPMFAQLKEMMGPAMADRVVIPDAMAGDTLSFEGERITVMDPMPGDTAVITPVYIEALDTLITSDIAFSDTHAYVAETTTTETLEAWRESLDRLEAIGASTVIPGHRLETSANDGAAFAHTRAYLAGWEAAMDEATTADELRAALIERVGDLPVPFFVERAVAAVYG